MKIKLTSIMVDNQEKALKFYTEVFGFVKKHDIPVGEFRWLTVVSLQGPDNLEPIAVCADTCGNLIQLYQPG